MTTTATNEVTTVVLNDDAWLIERDAVTRRFLGITAAEFVQAYTDGVYDDCEPDGLMAVLGYFPELDR